jgi:hypothetical protein
MQVLLFVLPSHQRYGNDVFQAISPVRSLYRDLIVDRCPFRKS